MDAPLVLHTSSYLCPSRKKERDDQRPRTTLTLLYIKSLSGSQTDPCALRHPGCVLSDEHHSARACAPQLQARTWYPRKSRKVLCTVYHVMVAPRSTLVRLYRHVQPETPASRTPTGVPRRGM